MLPGEPGAVPSMYLSYPSPTSNAFPNICICVCSSQSIVPCHYHWHLMYLHPPTLTTNAAAVAAFPLCSPAIICTPQPSFMPYCSHSFSVAIAPAVAVAGLYTHILLLHSLLLLLLALPLLLTHVCTPSSPHC